VLFKITFRGGSNKATRTIKADRFEEVPHGFITFMSGSGEQLLTIRKDEIDLIDAA
jgi:hypothetical protein